MNALPHNTPRRNPPPGPGFLGELGDTAELRKGLARGARWFRLRADSETTKTSAQSRTHLNLISRASTLTLVGITLAYLAAEVLWNIQLMETIARAGASRIEVETMVNHGRWLAAFGLVWALLRSILFSRKSGLDGVVNWVLFVSAIVVAYASIGGLYSRAIDSLSPATSIHAFELAAHRNWALKDDLEPTRQARVDAATKDAPAVALWALNMGDPAIVADADAEYQSRRQGLSSDSVSAALAKYPEIEAARKKLAAAGSVGALAEFEKGYAEYIAKSRKVDAIRFASTKREGIKMFADGTCGMLPNANATKADFAREMTKSCILNYRKGGEAYLANELAVSADPVVYDNQGIKIHFSQVKDLNESQFTTFVRDRASGLVNEQLPTEETVKSNPKAHDVISSIIVPPISMLLSMIGIVANLGGALAMVVGLKRFQGIASMLALVLAAALIPAGAPAGMAQAWKTFSTEHSVLSFAAGKVISAERTLISIKGATL